MSREGPRYVQLVPAAVDEMAAALSFTARAVLVDLLLRVDYTSGRFVTTLLDYAAHLGMTRRRLAEAMRELEEHKCVEARFPRGHDGVVEIVDAVFHGCVRMRGTRAPQGLRMGDASAESREPPGETPPDQRPIDERHQERSLSARFVALCGRHGIESDDAKKALAKIQIEDDIADTLIDVAIGRAEEQERKGAAIVNPIGYVRASARNDLAFHTGAAGAR